VAISEPEVTQRNADGPPGDAAARWHLPWWSWLVAAVGVLVLAVGVVFWVLAATYQPVGFGDAWGGYFAGMPTVHEQPVNTFGELPGEIYVAPQRDAFTIVESIVNNGPEPVTIEAVSAVEPEQLAQLHEPYPLGPYPLANAGPVRWGITQPTMSVLRSVKACTQFHPCSLSHLSLAPQEDVFVAIPVRIAYACYIDNAYQVADSFYVEERFGPFTHWVKLLYGTPYIFRQPAPVGYGTGSTCPSP
jgi:hypothetical protein